VKFLWLVKFGGRRLVYRVIAVFAIIVVFGAFAVFVVIRRAQFLNRTAYKMDFGEILGCRTCGWAHIAKKSCQSDNPPML